jgi:threonine dehydratase
MSATDFNLEVNLQTIEEAEARIAQIVPATPVTKSLTLSSDCGRPVWLKMESFNLSGSFKIRGAANALIRNQDAARAQGVVAASAGNHAQGVAYISKLLGIKSRIFMPERTPIVKVEATRRFGANVVLTGHVYDDAYKAAVASMEKDGGVFVHPFADADVVNGQGTVGLEIMRQIQNLGIVVIPIGGGGLASGIGCAIKSINSSVKIIGVQTKSFPSMRVSLAAHSPTEVPPSLTIADGIAVKRPSERTLRLVEKYVDDIVEVDDSEIAGAIMNLMEKDHLLAEGAGAVSVAALQKITTMFEKMPAEKSICCIISGGNIDVTLLGRIAARGLIASGRMMRLHVTTKDVPGRLAETLAAISRTGANLIEVRHNRNFGALYYSDVDIEIELETSNFAHQRQVVQCLKDIGINPTKVNDGSTS